MNTFKPNAELIETDLETELVLLNPQTQAMFSLNETGRLIWRTLPSGGVVGASEAVAAQFEVSPQQAETDTRTLVQHLLEAELLETA